MTAAALIGNWSGVLLSATVIVLVIVLAGVGGRER